MQFLKKYISKYWKGFLAAVVFLTLRAICDLMLPAAGILYPVIGVYSKIHYSQFKNIVD